MRHQPADVGRLSPTADPAADNAKLLLTILLHLTTLGHGDVAEMLEERGC